MSLKSSRGRNFRLGFFVTLTLIAFAPALTPGAAQAANPHHGGGACTAPLCGIVMSGSSAISGATVALWQAGTTGNGVGATEVGSSTTTDSAGAWGFPGFTCSSGSTTQYYVTASGGGTSKKTNSAIALMAAIGPCGAITTPQMNVVINEATTVAAVYALNPFLDPNSPHDVGAASGNVAVGLANAMAVANSMVDVTTGTSLAVTPNGAGALPQARLDTLANALMQCTGSSSSGSAACVELLNCATPGATFVPGTKHNTPSTCSVPANSTPPSDTLAAALSIARNPALVSLSGIFDVANGGAQFYTPAMSSAPADWTLTISFGPAAPIATSPELKNPDAVAIDGAGNPWVGNCGKRCTGSTSASYGLELSPLGATLSPSGGYTGGGMFDPYFIAIAGGGNAWFANYDSDSGTNGGNGSVTALDSSGAALSGSPFTSSMANPDGAAIDQSGNIWIADGSDLVDSVMGPAVTELDSTGALVGTGAQYIGSTEAASAAVAIDSSGNPWVAIAAVFGLSGTTTGVSEVARLCGATAINCTLATFTQGLDQPSAIAIDATGDAWVANCGRECDGSSLIGSVTEMSSTGTQLNTEVTGGGINMPMGIAIDSAGDAWVANQVGNSVTELSASGAAPLSPSSGFSNSASGVAAGGFCAPVGIAVDPSGNVWVAGQQGCLSEIVGAAAPVKTPMSGPPAAP